MVNEAEPMNGPRSWQLRISVVLVPVLVLLLCAPANASHLRPFGSDSNGPIEFRDAEGMGVDDLGRVYIPEGNIDAVRRFSPTGQLQTTFATGDNGEGSVRAPYDVAISSSGDVYVAEFGDRQISRFGSDGTFIGSFQGPLGMSPTAVDFGPDGSIFVADYAGNRIQKFTANGEFVLSWGEQGDGPGEFENPSDLAVGPESNVYVADTSNDRVQVFDSNGEYLATYGGPGAKPGQFSFVGGVAAGDDGAIYVSDTNNHRIQKLSAGGDFLRQWQLSSNQNPRRIQRVPGTDRVLFSETDQVFSLDTSIRKFKRRVTLTYNYPDLEFHGRVSSDAYGCQLSANVSIFKKRRGRDDRIGRAKADGQGRFSERVLRPDRARYYAVVTKKTLVGSGGTCLAKKSRSKLVRPL